MILNSKLTNFYLKSIDLNDIELLRIWKNRHKNSFFHKNEISQSEQVEWYERVYLRNDGEMFVVVVDGKEIGCMGFRFKGGYIDVYNIMRGESNKGIDFKMSDAFKLMNQYLAITYKRKVTCVVLNSNNAFDWYLKNGFEKREDFGEYSLLEYVSIDQDYFFNIH